MSVDIGETLIQSWLRHVKRCDLVQTNWKAAMHLGIDKDKADSLLVEMQKEFPFFATKQNATQIIRQLEIDDLGCIVDKKQYFACDIAFHESGLHYSGGEETVPSKILRTVLCLYSFLGAKKASIIFATPKFVADKDKIKLESFISKLNDCLKNKWNLGGYNVKLYAEYEFETNILNPVIQLIDEIKDTSEIFVRACQLIRSVRNNNGGKVSGRDYLTTAHGDVDVTELSSQDLIEQYIFPLLSKKSDRDLKPYFDITKSKNMFGGNYAFLSTSKIYTKVRGIDQCRYYASAYYLEKAKKPVYITNDCNRGKLLDWINNNITDLSI